MSKNNIFKPLKEKNSFTLTRKDQKKNLIKSPKINFDHTIIRPPNIVFSPLYLVHFILFYKYFYQTNTDLLQQGLFGSNKKKIQQNKNLLNPIIRFLFSI